MKISEIGKRYNKLTILKKVNPKKGRGDKTFLCLCDCGKKKKVTLSHLKSGTKSCGCLNKKLSSERRIIDIKNKSFGFLKPIKIHYIKNNCVFWLCDCKCGKTTIVSTRNLNSGNTKSCGCNHHPKGSESKLWKKEISIEDRINKRGTVKNKFYDEWVKNVFERDDYKCQLTNKKGKLQAHHLYSWNKYKNLRFNINNGITLLKPVHILFHKLYGRGDNTREQYEEFKNLYLNNKLNCKL